MLGDGSGGVGDGGEDLGAVLAGEPAGVGLDGGVGGFGVVAIDDESGELEAGLSDGGAGEGGVVEGAEVGSGDEEYGIGERDGEVERGAVAIEGDHDAADAFDEEQVVVGVDAGECVGDGVVVDGSAGGFGGGGGREGLAVADGGDGGEGFGRVGEVCEGFGVGADECVAFDAATGGEGFADADLVTGVFEDACEGAGDGGFTDAGVCAGDEEAGPGEGYWIKTWL